MKFPEIIPRSFNGIVMFLYSLDHFWSNSRIRLFPSIFESLSNEIVLSVNFSKNEEYLMSFFLATLLHGIFGLSLKSLSALYVFPLKKSSAFESSALFLLSFSIFAFWAAISFFNSSDSIRFHLLSQYLEISISIVLFSWLSFAVRLFHIGA